jgi:hypothetical protein
LGKITRNRRYAANEDETTDEFSSLGRLCPAHRGPAAQAQPKRPEFIVRQIIKGDAMSEFLLGTTTMGFWVIGLFFLRFWFQTRDRLFAIFAVAFWILGVNRFVFLMLIQVDEANNLPLYMVRLLAFSLILVAIVDKNRSEK